jgi:hypothetical protein
MYGENGSGKSSIYEALYSNFYNKQRVDKTFDVYETYKNRNNLGETLEVSVNIDNKFLKRTDNKLEDSDNMLDNSLFFLANENTLNSIMDNDFFNSIKITLQEHFLNLEELFVYDELKKELLQDTDLDNILKGTSSPEESNIENIKEQYNIKRKYYINKKIELDNEFPQIFKTFIAEEEINKIIKDKLKENFSISFKINNDSTLDIDTKKVTEPTINIQIDGIETTKTLHHHFNEAKLKLISIAIYFSLAKQYEETKQEASFKLLVLDDFLTSLDMANRKLIVQYILENFKHYQKIILTHNLQFYNLIKKMTDNNWDNKELYIFDKDYKSTTFIKDKNSSLLDEAQKYLKPPYYDLEIVGNKLRKYFEQIVQEFSQLSQLGKYDSLNSIITNIQNADTLYFHNKNANDLINDIREILKSDNNEIEEIKEKISHYENNNLIEDSIEIKKITNDIKFDINKANLYKQILLNPASHNDIDSDLYRKECENTLELLKNLQKKLKSIK